MFDEDGAVQALSAQAQLLRPEQPQPTMWQGFWKAAGGAIPAAINESARAAMKLATMEPTYIEQSDAEREASGLMSSEKAAARREARASTAAFGADADRALRSGVDFWAPDPMATGTASQIVFDLGKTLTKVGAYAVAGGLPGVTVGLSADEGINEAQRLQDAGVDPSTAAKAGSVRALTTAAGAAIPAFGQGVASTVGLVAASGPGSFIADQYAIKNILESADYAKKAQEYNPWDLTGLLVSTGVSAVIGGGGLYMRTRAATQQARERSRLGSVEDPSAMADAEAAARTMQTVEAMQAKALKPMEDLQGQIDHQNGMATAIRQMEDGEAVRVEDVVPVTEAEVAARMPFDPERMTIGDRLATRLRDDYPTLRKEYEALSGEDANSQGGRVLNTDIARELSPEYQADRTRSADVHEPASAFVKQLYAEKLAEIPKGSTVLFTAGGTGSGKSTAVKGLVKDDAALIYDTNMNTLQSAIDKIDAALAAGHKVKIAYVFRDPVDALVNGSLPRAERMGRTVPMREHLRTHQGVAETIPAIAERYKGDKRVQLTVIDNSRGRGNFAFARLDDLPKLDYNQVERALHENLSREYQAGRISESTFRGSGGERPSDAADARIAASGLLEGSDTRPGERAGDASAGQSAEVSQGSSPELQAAQQALAESDLPVVTGLTPDGQPIVRSARELLEEAQATEQQAKTDAKAFKAAVLCAIGREA